MRNLKKQLKNFKQLEPRSEWKAQNRNVLMQSISQKSVEADSSTFLFSKNTWTIFFKDLRIGQPILALFLVAAVVLGGSDFAVTAANQSVPGDKLYFVKRSLEKARLQFANDQESIKLEVFFAQERLTELQKIASGPDRVKAQPVLDEIQATFDSVVVRLDEIKAEDSSKNDVVEIAKLLDDTTEEISKSLKGVRENASTTDEFLVEAAISSVEGAGLNALKIIAEQVEEGKVELDEKGDVLERINRKLNALSEQASEIKNKKEGAEDIENIDENSNSQNNENTVELKEQTSLEQEVVSIEEDSENSALLESALDNIEDASKSLENDNLVSAVDSLEKGHLEVNNLKNNHSEIIDDSEQALEQENNEDDFQVGDSISSE